MVHQLPHWMFAMRDTLGSNTFRALAAIVADPAVEGHVREELDAVGGLDPAALDGLRYLEGCLEEAMRLWPTVPLIARETTRATTLAGERLEEGTQVMIANTFNHRDREQVPDADRLCPGRWAGGERDPRFNHLSNGSQYCPAIPLLLLLGKAVLARVLEAHTLTLHEPVLDPGRPLPHMVDFFAIRFGARPRRAGLGGRP
jgi:cytochrome P450